MTAAPTAGLGVDSRLAAHKVVAGRAAVAALALAAWIGCDRPPPQNPSLLARVGHRRITVDDLRAYEARLGDGAAGKADPRGRVQTLIDRELLLLEARARGLAQDEEVQRRLAESEARELAEAVLRQQVEQAAVTQDQVEKAYAEGWGEQIRALEMFMATQAQARRVRDLIQQGMDFAEAARRHGVDPYFRVPTGGARSALYWRFDRPRAVVEALFDLEPGGVTAPVPAMGGCVIATVVERRQAELAQAAPGIRRALLEERRRQLRQSYLRLLKWDFGTRFQPEGMELVVAVLKGEVAADSLGASRRRQPVYAFEGFEIDVGEVLEAVAPARAEWPEVSADAVNRQLAEEYMPNLLMARDARRKGVDQTEAFRRWRRARQEDLMLERLREQVVAAAPPVDEDDLEEYYQRHQQRFRSAPWARIQEILVEDADRARGLAAQIRQGAEMRPLALAHSLRDREDGILEVSTSHAPAFGEAWMQAVMSAPLNQVQGPIQAKGGYSVFRVLERHPERTYTLANERVRRSVTREVRLKHEREAFNRYLEGLRRQYADRIEVHGDRVDQLAREETAKGERI